MSATKRFRRNYDPPTCHHCGGDLPPVGDVFCLLAGGWIPVLPPAPEQIVAQGKYRYHLSCYSAQQRGVKDATKPKETQTIGRAVGGRVIRDPRGL